MGARKIHGQGDRQVSGARRGDGNLETFPLERSQQFPTDIGRIDILAKDKSDGCYVVIELKRNQTSFL